MLQQQQPTNNNNNQQSITGLVLSQIGAGIQFGLLNKPETVGLAMERIVYNLLHLPYFYLSLWAFVSFICVIYNIHYALSTIFFALLLFGVRVLVGDKHQPLKEMPYKAFTMVLLSFQLYMILVIAFNAEMVMVLVIMVALSVTFAHGSMYPTPVGSISYLDPV